MEISRKLSVAPMMDWTDRHERYFLRLLSRRTLLYTEMVTTGALLHGDAARFLRFDAAEHPVALQLGGSDPVALSECAAMGEAWGYDEINMNVGCPSDRVQSGRFGACLMAEPEVVRDAVAAMCAVTKIPVTVKSRIGVDDQDSYEDLRNFIACVSDGGCKTFIIHARKALLSGLSPKQNREIPPLKYEYVFRIKQAFPELTIVLNGGVETLDSAVSYLDRVDGVMIGRSAYRDPWLLAEADSRLYGDSDPLAVREDAIIRFLPYVRQRLAEGVPLHAMTRHILGLFNGLRGARQWRRFLSENAYRAGADAGVIESALSFVQNHDAASVRRAAAI